MSDYVQIAHVTGWGEVTLAAAIAQIVASMVTTFVVVKKF